MKSFPGTTLANHRVYCHYHHGITAAKDILKELPDSSYEVNGGSSKRQPTTKNKKTMKSNILVSGLLGVLVLASVGTVFAKVEVIGGAAATVCSPISSLTAKGDPTVSESGFSSVQMGWSVKPCSKTQTVRVVACIINWNTKELVYADIDAGLNGKILISVEARQIYDCTVTVFDAVTGEQLDTKTFGASTIPKGV